ncbi:hypothetical protein QTP70_022475 [Hemibagrus guttatus]|uniref:Alkylated DNA repair protein AlkB homologue 8 N-terminal domain-containing protein n=1 Tax=Hemibagrus guttatus TaxID=175788 RepID=A0AAE0PZE8_9TELE|nr:hypothetical protein QTP70_022475 [Hemibagrus guttatus]
MMAEDDVEAFLETFEQTCCQGAASGSYSTNHIVKFTDHTTLVGLMTNNNKANYSSEVSRLVQWCNNNNLFLNMGKTKEIVFDFRRGPPQDPSLTINGVIVERVNSHKFLGVHISEDLSWMTNTTSLAKKAQSSLYYLRKLRKA